MDDPRIVANERLTATTATVLLALLAVEGFTILSIAGFSRYTSSSGCS